MPRISKPEPEQTQKGNPHRLTFDQHVFPIASIKRFLGANGLVDVSRDGKTFPAKPDNPIFCARRAWNQMMESRQGKRIEDEFQPIASQLADGSVDVITQQHKDAADSFFALWYWRAEARTLDLPDGVLPASVEKETLSKDHLERLEQNGCIAFRSDGSLAARHMMSTKKCASACAACATAWPRRSGVSCAQGMESSSFPMSAQGRAYAGDANAVPIRRRNR